jgi:membrane protease YdiL (CAAX protease family)
MLTKSPIAALILVTACTAIAAVLFAKLPYHYRLAAIAVSYVLIGLFVFTTQEKLQLIGLSSNTLLQGLKLALPFMLIIIGVGLLAYFIQPSLFQDPRYDMTLPRLLVSIFIVLPFATVLIEELIFRGVLFGLLSSVTTTLPAAALSSLMFGIWHVFSAQSVTLSFIRIPQALIIIGVIIATALAGLFFTWLRTRSGSLITPILVHWSINATGMLLAYLSWKN